jgi:O-antigen/teichoic acid export membrane protein
MSRRARSFPVSVGITLASRWMVLALTIAGGIVVARTLGPGQKGAFVLTFLLLGQTLAVGSFGAPHALVYFLAGGKVTRAEAAGHFLVTSAVSAALLVVPYVAIVVCAGDRLFKGVEPSTLIYLALLILPSLATANAGGVLRGLGRLDLFNLLRLLDAATSFGCLFVALVVLRTGLGGAVVAGALSTTLTGAAAVGLVLHTAGTRPRFHLASMPALVGFGLRSYLTVMLQLTERKLDLFLLGWFLPADGAAWQIGVYTTAVALAELPRTVSAAVSTVLLPRVAGADARRNAETVPLVSRHLTAVNLAFGAALVLVGHPLIGLLYGPEFLPAYLPFLLLLPGVVMAGVWNVFEAEMVGTGRPLRLSMFSGLTLALNFVLNLVAIPRWGIVGAALTSGFTYALLGFCLVLDYRARNQGVSLRDLLVVSPREIVRRVPLSWRLRLPQGAAR